jgi:hypothetical protein
VAVPTTEWIISLFSQLSTSRLNCLLLPFISDGIVENLAVKFKFDQQASQKYGCMFEAEHTLTCQSSLSVIAFMNRIMLISRSVSKGRLLAIIVNFGRSSLKQISQAYTA